LLLKYWQDEIFLLPFAFHGCRLKQIADTISINSEKRSILIIILSRYMDRENCCHVTCIMNAWLHTYF